MTILNDGVNRIRDNTQTDLYKGEVGTDGTESAESDTGLGTPIATSLLDFDISLLFFLNLNQEKQSKPIFCQILLFYNIALQQKHKHNHLLLCELHQQLIKKHLLN